MTESFFFSHFCMPPFCLFSPATFKLRKQTFTRNFQLCASYQKNSCWSVLFLSIPFHLLQPGATVLSFQPCPLQIKKTNFYQEFSITHVLSEKYTCWSLLLLSISLQWKKREFYPFWRIKRIFIQPTRKKSRFLPIFGEANVYLHN